MYDRNNDGKITFAEAQNFGTTSIADFRWSDKDENNLISTWELAELNAKP